MKFPWVSRELYEEKQLQVAELKEQLRKLQEENRALMNQIVWRSSSVALDPSLLPEQYRPRAGQTATKSESATESAKTTTVGGGPQRVRERIRQAERERETEFLRNQGVTVPASGEQDAARDLAAKLEVVAKVSQTVDEATKEATA